MASSNGAGSYKDDKGYQSYLRRKAVKTKLTGVVVLCGLVAVVGVAGYGVLRLNGFSFGKKVPPTDFSLDSIPDEVSERMILQAKNFDSEANTLQFNTIFGGVDYNKEYNDYKMKSGNTDLDTLIWHLSKEVSLENKFDNLDEWTNAQAIADGFYTSDLWYVNKYSPMTDELLMGDNAVTLTCTCVGVVNNYFGVYWLEGTDYYFVSDERNTLLSTDYFYNQMLHIGEDCYFTFTTQSALVEFYDELDARIVYIPPYDFSSADTVASNEDDNSATFDRFAFCEVNATDSDVVLSFLRLHGENFNFSPSSFTLADIPRGRARTFSSRQHDIVEDIFNSDWNNKAENQTEETIGAYTFKGTGFICKSDNYVALKYSEDVYILLDITNASREVTQYNSSNSFVAPFTLLSSNIRVFTEGSKTFILGYFI